MQALRFLLSLRPALPFSIERPCQVASNGEVARWLRNGAVHVNGQAVGPDTEVDEVHSLVFFPSSPRRRCTLL